MLFVSARFVTMSPTSSKPIGGQSARIPTWRSCLASPTPCIPKTLHDTSFLHSHCVGYDRFVEYLTGTSDGVGERRRLGPPHCVRSTPTRFERSPGAYGTGAVPALDQLVVATVRTRRPAVLDAHGAGGHARQHWFAGPRCWLRATAASTTMGSRGVTRCRSASQRFPRAPTRCRTTSRLLVSPTWLSKPGQTFPFKRQRVDLSRYQARVLGRRVTRFTTIRT